MNPYKMIFLFLTINFITLFSFSWATDNSSSVQETPEQNWGEGVVEKQVLKSLFPDGEIGTFKLQADMVKVFHPLTPTLKEFLENKDAAEVTDGYKTPWSSQVIKAFQLAPQNYLVLIETYHEKERDHHMNGGVIGYAIIQLDGATVKKVQDLKYFDELGAFGRLTADRDGASLISIGPKKTGIILRAGNMHHGDLSEICMLYEWTKQGPEQRLMFIIPTSDRATKIEAPYFTTQFNLLPNPNQQKHGYYNLILSIQKWTKNSDQFIVNQTNDIFTLEFDGQHYIDQIPDEKYDLYNIDIETFKKEE